MARSRSSVSESVSSPLLALVSLLSTGCRQGDVSQVDPADQGLGGDRGLGGGEMKDTPAKDTLRSRLASEVLLPMLLLLLLVLPTST